MRYATLEVSPVIANVVAPGVPSATNAVAKADWRTDYTLLPDAYRPANRRPAALCKLPFDPVGAISQPSGLSPTFR